jgi:translation initiation factor 5A
LGEFGFLRLSQGDISLGCVPSYLAILKIDFPLNFCCTKITVKNKFLQIVYKANKFFLTAPSSPFGPDNLCLKNLFAILGQLKRKFHKWRANFYKENRFLVLMVARVIEATEMRIGTYLILDGVAHQVKKMDISKTGKHGHAKVRFEAVNAFSGKKKVGVVPGHDKFEVPMIDKREAQVLSVSGSSVSVMDSVTFENFDLDIPEELQGSVSDGTSVEYWDIEGEKLLKKVL